MADKSFEDEGFSLVEISEEAQKPKALNDNMVFPHFGRDSEEAQRLKEETNSYRGLPLVDDLEVQKLEEEIKDNKQKHFFLLGEIEYMEGEKQEYVNITGKFENQLKRLQGKLSESEQALEQNALAYEEKCRNLQKEQLELTDKIYNIKEEIDHCERTTNELEKVYLSGVERKMIFKGNVTDSSSGLSVKHQITYPVNGGSALITFKEQDVAAQVISDKHHTINIEEDCRISVKAEPVELFVLDTLHMVMSPSRAKILVYNLPQNMSEETILDKLELYFSKSKNGGGEVDKTEFLSDCRGAIITFTNDSVASHLVERKSFRIPFGNSEYQVSVAPSLDGTLQNYEMKKLKCNRTVLLTGIPDITDKDNLQDLLELHFHKYSNDGVHALMYCPEDTMAFFEDDHDDLPNTE